MRTISSIRAATLVMEAVGAVEAVAPVATALRVAPVVTALRQPAELPTTRSQKLSDLHDKFATVIDTTRILDVVHLRAARNGRPS
jgi:hypothetical protein